MTKITLERTSMRGEIYIGEGVIEDRLPQLLAAQKNFVVTDSNVYSLYADFFKKWFSGCEIFVLTAGEENKNFHSLYAILEKMTGAGLHRTSRLFAVGGGVVGDIGGLAAALYMRGISCVQIPTTLLAQVDSSVGGKTAVDLCGVKNVVGAFYQPMEVLIEPAFLKTLPQREMKCGMGEIVKYAALSKDIYESLTKNKEALNDLSFLSTLIEACVRHKAEVVERDEKETGERKSLNVGHTTGHAIELNSTLSHGECVLYGTYLETAVAIEKGVCQREYGECILQLVKTALAIAPNEKFDFSCIRIYAENARSDKKNADDGKINLAVPKALGEWAMLSLPFEEYVLAIERAVESL